MKNTVIFLLAIMLSSSCKKIGVDDPKISFRSRNARIIGKWDVTEYYYYDGHLSGVNKSGDPAEYNIEINENGEWYIYEDDWSKGYYEGHWNWVSPSGSLGNKECFVLGRQGHPILWAESHILEELRDKKMRSRYNFDTSDPLRYYIYEWVAK